MRRSLRLAIVVLGASAFVGVPTAVADDAFLTSEEQAKLVGLVQGDARIRSAIEGGDVRVENVMPWSADGTRETLIGGGVTLAFQHPRTVEADWPLMDFPDDSAHYTVTTVHYRVADADRIDAWVDLRKGRVVSVDVGDGTVDQNTIREVSPARTATSAKGDSGRGEPSSALLAALVMGSLLASGIALGRRYGPTGD